MKVLWVTNTLLPEVKAIISTDSGFRGSGGWVLSLANAIIAKGGFNLHIATITSLVKSFQVINGRDVTYYLIPVGKGDSKYNKDYELCYRSIYDMVNPDVVHIHGTEYPHSLAALRAFGSEHTVISLQGLVSEIAPYYLGGLSHSEIRKNVTFHDTVRSNLLQQQKEMAQRGVYEQMLLTEAKHILGRTSWDYAHTWEINPDCNYYHCYEILREEFYSGGWMYEACQPHSIFASQSYYPLKGLHILLDAIDIVVRYYPDAVLRVAGNDFSYRGGVFSDKLRLSAYGKLIRNKMRAYGIEDKVKFTGMLNAAEMKGEYLRSNVFVCPSCIENSPNSLAEAQLLGVPCVASYVGGIPDMMRGDEDGLYRFEEVEMLANKICNIFNKKDKVDTSVMKEKALLRHNPQTIVNDLIAAYEIVCR